MTSGTSAGSSALARSSLSGRSCSARIEAFHYDLGSSTYVLATGDRSIDVEANVLRAGVNYRFCFLPKTHGRHAYPRGVEIIYG